MANAVDDARDSRRLVRMYSGDVEGRLPYGSNAQVLGQVLSQERPDPRDVSNPWRKFFDTWEPEGTEQDPITSVITVESNKLREKWASFLSNSSGHDRLNLARSEPTMEGVVELVKEIAAAAQTKKDNSRRGKVVKYFHKFCGTIDSHKSMLELIPQGSEYVSIFAGTLNVIIQASVNHERIAEGLSEALCTISECVVDCRTELELFRTQAMMQLIADFYAHIFIFLSDVMDWITEKRRKRLLDSFNENFYQKFEGQIAKIKHKSDMIRNLAAQSSRAEQRATRLTIEELAQDVRLGLTGEERRHAEMAYYAERIERELVEGRRERQLLREDGQHFKQLADRLTSMLQDKAMVWIRDMRSMNGDLPPGFPFLQAMVSTDQIMNMGRAASADVSPVVFDWTSEEVLFNSKHLEDFFYRDRVRLHIDPLSPTTVSPETLRRLGDWMKNVSSRFLWLEGPPTEADDFDNPITMLANQVVELAEQSRIPVVSYCCELRRGERLRSGNETREAQACVSLVCGLLRQMTELLLPKFEAGADLSPSRLRLVDGSIMCWSEMLRLFRDLLPLMPDVLLCVIDGFQWIDDRSTSRYLEEFIDAIRGSKLKVLVTTTGRSACLRKHIRPTETIVIETLDLRDVSWGLDRNNSWARK
ncbi:hypothetical protein F4775DRAFT_547723 [Biscogniauxia sp. FL1348]|nr:hypothetical protein F4775DRAFT_547723 [Biscogniauxia sp. FL1348]